VLQGTEEQNALAVSKLTLDVSNAFALHTMRPPR